MGNRPATRLPEMHRPMSAGVTCLQGQAGGVAVAEAVQLEC